MIKLLGENNYSETDEFTLVKEMSHWINALKRDFVDDKKAQKAIAQYFYYDEGKHQEDFKEFEATVKQLHKIWLKLDKISDKIENRNIKEAVHSETNTIDIIRNFFEQQGWNVNDPEVQNYMNGVYDLLIQDPEWIDGTYTMNDWYLDTKVNFPSDIDWLDHTSWGY